MHKTMSSKDTKKCTKCGLSNTVKSGFSVNKSGKQQRYQCNDCGYNFTLSEKIEELKEEAILDVVPHIEFNFREDVDELKSLKFFCYFCDEWHYFDLFHGNTYPETTKVKIPCTNENSPFLNTDCFIRKAEVGCGDNIKYMTLNTYFYIEKTLCRGIVIIFGSKNDEYFDYGQINVYYKEGTWHYITSALGIAPSFESDYAIWEPIMEEHPFLKVHIDAITVPDKSFKSIIRDIRTTIVNNNMHMENIEK